MNRVGVSGSWLAKKSRSSWMVLLELGMLYMLHRMNSESEVFTFIAVTWVLGISTVDHDDELSNVLTYIAQPYGERLSVAFAGRMRVQWDGFSDGRRARNFGHSWMHKMSVFFGFMA
ncbi:hypothetical protein ARMSODRAFT_480354 [Armillaria solidipes]|uniref:Uncharacterized protein n=1 Tax=Armillaria solidipes TaxID=1076256 RepID=A0A2H3BYA7_9AGAR|nr:hypothetical protein ARMSODRAFT_480354 [Armillaria solidipes]